jgi:hypothetical protein
LENLIIFKVSADEIMLVEIIAAEARSSLIRTIWDAESKCDQHLCSCIKKEQINQKKQYCKRY